MIPRAAITAWRTFAPWATDAQVEQDLVLSRAIVEIFSEPTLASALVFRGRNGAAQALPHPRRTILRGHRSRAGRAGTDRSRDGRVTRPLRRMAGQTPEELLGTKLRALYQRKKGRDLFDMATTLRRLPALEAAKVVDCFTRYLAHTGKRVSRAEYEANLAEKIDDPAFTKDILPLLTHGGRI